MKTDKSVDNIVKGILAYLEAKKELDLLPQIAESLKKLSWVKVDPDLAVVYSQQKLSSAQINQIKTVLQSLAKHQVRVINRIDLSIIAGFKINFAGREIDSTVNRRLEELKDHLNYV